MEIVAWIILVVVLAAAIFGSGGRSRYYDRDPYTKVE